MSSIGQCLLCGKHGTVVDSHVWPSFAYKRYVSDLERGGSFLELAKSDVSIHNKQVKRPWFCRTCDGDRIGESETYMRRLFEKLDRAPRAAHPYEALFQRFAISISYRSALLDLERNGRTAGNEQLRLACRKWREFLLGKRKGIKPYSQHAFAFFDPSHGLHQGIGAAVYRESGFIVSQVGPLFIVGLLDRSEISKQDLDVWQRSEVSESGTIERIDKWRAGYNITLDLCRTLSFQERWAVSTILANPSLRE